MKIWHISDTHGQHGLLKIPDNIDMIIFSGDCSNIRDPYRNEHEVRTFLIWLHSLDIRYKIMIAGNHDSSIEKKLITSFQILNDYDIIYLEDEAITIEGIKIYGSPWTPTFGNWSFNKARAKIDKIWRVIPNDIDILVTHGPPKGILDISENRYRDIEFCGDSSLKKHVLKIEPKFHMFGHIHNYKDHVNQGVMRLSNYKTIFSNGSVVKDGDFSKLSSNGNEFKI